ncbi:MAG: GNAT family N-acetyltransferase [Microbacterium arborescens]
MSESVPPIEADVPAGIDIRPLETVADIFAGAAVLREVWGGDRDSVPTNLMRALAYAGNYVVGLYDGDRVVGASVAFFSEPGARSMHSHVTGVLPQYQQQGLGRVLKQHQRAWAFARDVGTITWTFDPLFARNAHFNLQVLGARISDYLVDQYGLMDDGINRGDVTDRLMVTWPLAAPPQQRPADDRIVATIEVPADIHALRTSSPAEADAWRDRVRAQFLEHLGAGLTVGGFDDERGYLLVRR